MLRWIFLFSSFAVIYGAAALVWWYVQSDRRRQRVVRMLASNVNPEGTVRTTVLIEKPDRSAGLTAMFKAGKSRVWTGDIGRLSKGKFFLLTLFAAFIGFMVGTKLIGAIGILAPLIGAFAVGAIPRIYRSKRSDKRLAAIEEQFPDALVILIASREATMPAQNSRPPEKMEAAASTISGTSGISCPTINASASGNENARAMAVGFVVRERVRRSRERRVQAQPSIPAARSRTAMRSAAAAPRHSRVAEDMAEIFRRNSFAGTIRDSHRHCHELPQDRRPGKRDRSHRRRRGGARSRALLA